MYIYASEVYFYCVICIVICCAPGYLGSQLVYFLTLDLAVRETTLVIDDSHTFFTVVPVDICYLDDELIIFTLKRDPSVCSSVHPMSPSSLKCLYFSTVHEVSF